MSFKRDWSRVANRIYIYIYSFLLTCGIEVRVSLHLLASDTCPGSPALLWDTLGRRHSSLWPFVYSMFVLPLFPPYFRFSFFVFYFNFLLCQFARVLCHILFVYSFSCIFVPSPLLELCYLVHFFFNFASFMFSSSLFYIAILIFCRSFYLYYHASVLAISFSAPLCLNIVSFYVLVCVNNFCIIFVSLLLPYFLF